MVARQAPETQEIQVQGAMPEALEARAPLLQQYL
jgi:hypothetical protein